MMQLFEYVHIDTLKRELIDTNAYKLHASMTERIVFDGHGCQITLKFGFKTKENLNKVLLLYLFPKFHKN